MAEFSKAELLTEVSRIFQVSVDPGKEGGTLNTATEYGQLKNLVSTTFLVNPDTIFYLARLAANSLNYLVLQEVEILEDLMVLLEDLSETGTAVRDTASLNNARTAALALDAAASVTGRPEVKRFVRHIDSFAELLKKNVSSTSRGNILVRPREDARNAIQENLTILAEVHSSLVTRVILLRDILFDFLKQDIPSKVSRSVILEISARLSENVTTVEDTTDVENLELNRDLFLQTLANKTAIKLLDSFTDPSEVKIRSPNRPIPPTAKHFGRVIGSGNPASVTTSAGPWPLPVSAALELSDSGGATQTINLNTIAGSFLAGRNGETFEITADRKYLHVVVDPNIYNGTINVSVNSDPGELTLNEYFRLGFKHLGSTIGFTGIPVDPTDGSPRFITDLRTLQTFATGSYSGGQLSVAAFVAGDEGAIGFQAAHVGMYVIDSSGQRFEITSVADTNNCTIDPRNLTPGFGAGGSLRGSRSSGSGNTFLYFKPPLVFAITGGALVGPAVKTAELTVGTRTVADIVSDIEAETGPFPVTSPGSALNWHVKAEALVNSSPPRLALRIRSKDTPYAQISGRALVAQDPAAAGVVVSNSAHTVLGFLEGELDDTDLLTASELVDHVESTTGFGAQVVSTEIYSGTLNTLVDLSVVVDSGIDFSLLGIGEGDQVEIQTGIYLGVYRVLSVPSLGQLELDRSPFPSSETGLRYRIFREQVRISLESGDIGSYLEVVSTPSELELVTGKYYSTHTEFEAVDRNNNRLQFSKVIAGDLLKIVGDSTEYTVASVNDTSLVLAQGLPSNTAGVGFEVRSSLSRAFLALNGRLSTFISSKNLLGKNKFDRGVEVIDNAVSTAILPGREFASSRNHARRVIADLLSILTSDLLRSDEYSFSVPTSSDNLQDVLASYSVPAIRTFDDVLNALTERKYDRAANLLLRGDITGFYSTNEETGSYAGSVMSASRTVVNDLPPVSRTRADMLDEAYLASSVYETTDADEDYSDIEDQPEWNEE